MYLDHITNDELADVGRLAEMTTRAGMTVMRTVTQYKERQMAQLTVALKEYRMANPLIPKGDISDLSYFWAADSLPKQVVEEMPEQIRERLENLMQQLEQKNIVLSGEASWTLTDAGRKLLYDKAFVQDALKADIEYADKVRLAAGQQAAAQPAVSAEWKNVGEEIRRAAETAESNPKEAVKPLQDINKALKRDKVLCNSALQDAIDRTMKEIVQGDKTVSESVTGLANEIGDKADELLINFNDLTMRTGNEIRREATKSAAAGARDAGKAVTAPPPVIAIAEALLNSTRKVTRQITR